MVRTIVYSAILPLLGLELATATMALANQQLSLLGSTCLTRPGLDSMAASLSIVQMLISSLDEDLRQTGHIQYIPIVIVHHLQCYSHLQQGPTN